MFFFLSNNFSRHADAHIYLRSVHGHVTFQGVCESTYRVSVILFLIFRWSSSIDAVVSIDWTWNVLKKFVGSKIVKMSKLILYTSELSPATRSTKVLIRILGLDVDYRLVAFTVCMAFNNLFISAVQSMLLMVNNWNRISWKSIRHIHYPHSTITDSFCGTVMQSIPICWRNMEEIIRSCIRAMFLNVRELINFYTLMAAHYFPDLVA